MPGSSAAFRSQWNISKSTLGIETVVTQETLVMALVLDDRHVPAFTQLSEQADNLRPSSWWHSLFTYQLPLAGECTSQPTKTFLGAFIDFESTHWLGGSNWHDGEPNPRKVLGRPHSGPLWAAAFTALMRGGTQGQRACVICLHQSVGGKPSQCFFFLTALHGNQLTHCHT